MSSYLTDAQVASLLKPINPNRVGKVNNKYSHVQAYDIRATLTRAFGFGRWSTDVRSVDLVFEATNEKKDRFTVCYRAVVSVTVCAPDGTVLATYADGATGEAVNQPSRGDAHDLAMKTAMSQAFKRAAVNLGDQFGLSLYNAGSTGALVRMTLVNGVPVEKAAEQGNGEDAPDETPALDAHIDAPLAFEDEAAPEPRERSGQSTAEPPVVDGTPEIVAAAIYAELVNWDHDDNLTDQQWVGTLMKRAQAAKCLGVAVDTDAGPMALKLLLQQAVANAA